MNNEYKHTSLEHCAFWKPKDTKYKSVFNYNEIIYDLKNKENKQAIRWGQLMELILSCNFGFKRDDKDLYPMFSFEEIIHSVEHMKQYFANNSENDETLYIINLGIPN